MKNSQKIFKKFSVFFHDFFPIIFFSKHGELQNREIVRTVSSTRHPRFSAHISPQHTTDLVWFSGITIILSELCPCPSTGVSTVSYSKFSTLRSNNRSINQSFNRWINQSINQSINGLGSPVTFIVYSINQSIDWLPFRNQFSLWIVEVSRFW